MQGLCTICINRWVVRSPGLCILTGGLESTNACTKASRLS